MYYEVHGRRGGLPLVLLHGGGSTIESTFGKVLPCLARHRQVIALEEQGHGRTSDRNEPFGFESSADDVATLLQQLEVEEADLFGFSNGASVALQVAIRHPERVRKLVFASAVTKREGAYPQLWEFMEQAGVRSKKVRTGSSGRNPRVVRCIRGSRSAAWGHFRKPVSREAFSPDDPNSFLDRTQQALT
ncbi:MAG: alpha/beta fold hydrolase [Gemmatimonas sp.]|nr:alpha/beta fold hydrolase [Gemmatimonas sp.]